MGRNVFLLLLFLFSENIDAQFFHWAKGVGGLNYEFGWSVETDSKGNIYTLGQCSNYLDADPGPGVSASTGDNGDICLLKLNPQGNFIWIRRIGSGGTQKGYDLSIDAQDNVFVTGNFMGTIDFDPGAGVYNLTSGGGYDIFFLKLDSSGKFQWVKQISGLTNSTSNAIKVCPSGAIYLSGKYTSLTDFNPGPGVYNLNTTTYALFIARYNNQGDIIWARSVADGGYGLVSGLSIDSSENVWVTGGFKYSTDFDPLASVYPLSSAGDLDIFFTEA